MLTGDSQSENGNYSLPFMGGAVGWVFFHFLLAYLLYMLARIVYFLENYKDFFSVTLKDNDIWELLAGSLKFDTSAIMYTNALVALLILVPYSIKHKEKIVRWVFTIINGLALGINLADAAYFRFTGRRTTMSVIQEFGNEDNIGNILGIEVLRHWYLVICWVIGIVCLWYGSAYIFRHCRFSLKNKWTGLTIDIVSLLIFIPLCIAGMRGGFTTAVRPITISNANQYVVHPQEAAIVLNTPFSLIRTIGKHTFKDPRYFSDKELADIYSPIHEATNDSIQMKKKNVVVLIVESFGREYIGSLNTELDNGRYKGYTPEIDEIVAKSFTFDHTFCNGRKSIDGMPSILSSIPMFIEPFFVTPSSMNDVSGIAGELSKLGYETAFFHGAENGSMGFEAFARKTGFKHYLGRTEFDADKRFGGEKEFDGTWAIWDEPFLQFYAAKMSEMKEPFMTAVFTASSHHPFAIPEKYQNVYKNDGPNPIHRCIRYTDHALGEFFRTASKAPWFKNTIFVITSDHTNGVDHKEYATDLGVFCSPVIIYDASGEIKPERRHCIAQQIDIMPTLLSHLGYKNKYVAFGQDLFSTVDEDTWAVNYLNGIYQFIKGDYVIQFDGTHVKAMYNFRKDVLMKHNLAGKGIAQEKDMERQLKGIIQSYMQRMEQNKLQI